jgi:hypothetical protein
MNWKILGPVALGVFTAARVDFNAYRNAVESWKLEVKNNPTLVRPGFDFALCLTRVMDGAIAGLTVGLALEQYGPIQPVV